MLVPARAAPKTSTPPGPADSGSRPAFYMLRKTRFVGLLSVIPENVQEEQALREGLDIATVSKKEENLPLETSSPAAVADVENVVSLVSAFLKLFRCILQKLITHNSFQNQ